MIKRKFKKIIKPVEEIISETAICDKCGETFIKDLNIASPSFYRAELQTIEILFGYPSIYDGLLLRFDICTNCLVNFIKTFTNKEILKSLE